MFFRSVTYFRDVNRIRLSFRLPNKIGDKSIVMKPFRVNSFNKQGTKVSFPNRKPLFDVSKRPNPAALNYKRYIKNIALGRGWGYWKTRVDGFRFTFVVDIEQGFKLFFFIKMYGLHNFDLFFFFF